MYKIINRHVYELANGENVTLCDIVADASTDLPDADDQAIYKIAFGSFAFSIADKCFYCLDSSGTWKSADINASDFYTKAEIDAFLLTINTTLNEDRAALAELVDSGAKNFINVGFTSKSATATTPSITNNDDGSITLNGSNTENNPVIVHDICSDLVELQDTRYTLPAGVYELCGSGNEDVVLQVYMHDGTAANLIRLATSSTSNAVEFSYTSDFKTAYPYICFSLYIKSPTASHEVSFDNVIVRPMVCTKAAWDISQTYQPYRPSEDEQNVIINSKANLENIAYKTAASSFNGTNMQVIFDENMFSQSSFRGSVLMMFGTQKTSVSNTLLLVDFYDGGIKNIRYLTSGTGEVITAIGTIHNNKHGFNFTADANSYTYPCCLSLFANKDILPRFTVSVVT